ncbi:MAG: alpha/beta hydrolase [Agitococcus sp.]|nr:alpha/beta hydrolase [Agitococcus sp.]
MPFITLRDQQKMHVRVLGRGQAVMMLPGLGMSSSQWLPYIVPYLRQFRFYLPDFRGFGLSADVRLNQSDVFHNHMQDVQDVIAHFRLQDFLLAGISLGGSTALHLQKEGGFTGVRRYLHIDQSPCVGNRHDWPHGLFGIRQDELFGQLHRLRDLLAIYPQYSAISELPAQVRQQTSVILAEVLALMTGRELLKPIFQHMLNRPSLSRFLPLTQLQDCVSYLSAYIGGGHDYRQSLRDCHTPITVMVGMKSPLYAPVGQMAIADYAQHVRIVPFHRSGHIPLVDEPIKFIRELGRFLHDD